jgi:hypothetical protein
MVASPCLPGKNAAWDAAAGERLRWLNPTCERSMIGSRSCYRDLARRDQPVETLREGNWEFHPQGRVWGWVLYSEDAELLRSERKFRSLYDCKEDAARFGYRPAWAKSFHEVRIWSFFQDEFGQWRWRWSLPAKLLGGEFIGRPLSVFSPKRYPTLTQCVVGAKLNGYQPAQGDDAPRDEEVDPPPPGDNE